MCGIVGLHLKNSALEPRLGELLVPMVAALTSRGPDSAGIAVYADDLPSGSTRYSLRAPDSAGGRGPGAPAPAAAGRGTAPYPWHDLAERLSGVLGVGVTARLTANDTVLVAPGPPERFLAALRDGAPEVRLVAYGHALEVYKDVGDPTAMCDRYDVAKIAGYQGVGHTRMATESAVTTEHSHPFAPAADLTLVHNGSFSNHATVRRRLQDDGVAFDTDNDSEVAARYVARRLEEGADLGVALKGVLADLDGFFTLLVATATQFAVVRDPFACKPAVIAETDDYVAVGSEYVALADLPGVESARVFEPMPEEIHLWTRDGSR